MDMVSTSAFLLYTVFTYLLLSTGIGEESMPFCLALSGFHAVLLTLQLHRPASLATEAYGHRQVAFQKTPLNEPGRWELMDEFSGVWTSGAMLMF